MPSSSRPPARLTGGSPAVQPDPHPVVRSDEYVAMYSSGPMSAYTPPRAGAARAGAPPHRAAPDGIWPDRMWGEPPSPAPAASEEPIIDFGQLRELLGFPWRAVRRRRRLALGVFAAVFGAACLAALISPRRYDVETSILAQRNFVMPALGNPRRSVPAESDAPTRMAAEAVLNRQNLLDLIQEVRLEAAWPRLRSPAGRAKDALQALISGPLPAEERRERLVNYLRGQLWVAADEGTVRIGVHFPDPQLALQLVQVAQRNFLEKRHASEQSLIRESIGILETHVASAHDQIESALADVRKYTPPERRGSLVGAYGAPGASAGAGPVGAAPRRVRRDPAVAMLESDLSAKRAALANAEAARTQRANTVRARLAELQNTLGPAHPEVVSAQETLAALGTDSPELAALRAAARDAEAKLVAAGGSAAPVAVTRSAAPSDASLTSAALVRLATQAVDTVEAPQLTYARSRLKIAVADYEDLLDRLEGARIELETARAAFKYRYTIITPPQFPRRLAKPNVPFVLVGGIFVAAVLGTFAALAVDLGSGRVVEGWQVSRLIGLPVLGETPRA